MTNKEVQNITLESLRDWFKKEKWVRISSSGNIAGDCGTSKNKKSPDRCLPKAKAQSLTKAQRAATARKKKKAGAKGKTVVKNTKAAKVTRETANPQDGKAAPFGSGYKPTKKMKNEKTINEAMTKERLLAIMKNQDDAIVRLFDGTEYVVYSPYSDNKDNAEMWFDDSVIGINRDGDEREFRYDDIDDVSIYRNETKEAPAGHYFTKSGNLVKGRITQNARERGARKSDPKDNQRSKVPPVTQYKEIKRPSKQGIKRKIRKAFLHELTKEDIKNLVVGTIAEMQNENTITEKDDRCTRLAKSKYDTWPSAYASGAVVRCRRGEIWKKK